MNHTQHYANAMSKTILWSHKLVIIPAEQNLKVFLLPNFSDNHIANASPPRGGTEDVTFQN